MAYQSVDYFRANDELSKLFTHMFNEDDNKCYPQKDFVIDYQGYVSNPFHNVKDHARRNLFQSINPEVLNRDSYKAFIALLDNYETELGKPETVTREEWREMVEFINIIMTKKVMKIAQKFLISKGLASENENEFKNKLYHLWFDLISRTKGNRAKDSSSFEHVFVGETKHGEVKGLHNWIQFLLQEKLGNIDYKGYLRRDTIKTDSIPRLLTIQFTWKADSKKPIGTIFLGTSPEFEIAVYTILRLLNESKTNIQLSEYETEITCYALGEGIGTAYISAAKE